MRRGLLCSGTALLASFVAQPQTSAESSAVDQVPPASAQVPVSVTRTFAASSEVAPSSRLAEQVARLNTKQASLSCGRANRGGLAAPAHMPNVGYGFLVPEPWRSRSLRYGTDELVELIQRTAAAVADEHPGAILGVADLSRKSGGAVPAHRSHQSGRDVDLLYYAELEDGSGFAPDSSMPYFSSTGRATFARSPTRMAIAPRRFHAGANWSLIKAMITDEQIHVDRIFVSYRVRKWILDYATKNGEPAELIAAAGDVLKLNASRAHNDHMHVRVGCTEADAEAGRCRDEIAKRPRRGGKWYGRISCNTPQLAVNP